MSENQNEEVELLRDILRISHLQLKESQKIMSKVSDLNAILVAADATLTTILSEVQTLEASLTNVDLPADAQASLDKLNSLVTAIQTALTAAGTTSTSPTLNPIAAVNAPLSAGAVTVSLTGIGSTASKPTITVMATASDGGSVIATPSVSYNTPDATGSITITPVAVGTSTVTVTVNDGVANAVQVFTVTVS